jgi:Amt family ammonium transporter
MLIPEYRENVLRKGGILLLLFLVIGGSMAIAEEPVVVDPVAVAVDAAKSELQNSINIAWTLVAAFLVFFMQAGFAMVETGFTRAKNAVNILMKNLMDFSIGTPAFFLVGFGLMFGATNGFCGTTLFGLSGSEPGTGWNWTFLIFQTVFAATAATIVSGAMAERTKFASYLVYSFFITLIIYPIFGSWAWGNLLLTDNNSWLAVMGFHDFAGSTVVHSIGGWLALAGAIILGPRTGKYGPDGKPKAIMGHNIPMAALGVFILWFGWFGFNPGSTLAANELAGYIAVTTNLAAAAGAISS